ncbi:MAG: DEAD/DEAH box helicase [Verrucomicrobia bacterium]|nr:DEAD/DEAH box helicase [Verrucomicrobiota bacterium]
MAGIECMAEGHSFHLCSNEILLSYPWALDKVVQAEDRSHRLNSRKDLNVYRLICDGSIDRKMESQIEEKADAAELVLDGHLLGEMGTELNLAELLDIAAKEFDEATKTIDESVLESEWPALRGRLREAFGLWQEGHHECADVRTAQPAALPLVVPSPIEPPIQSPILLAGIAGWRQRWLRRATAAA